MPDIILKSTPKEELYWFVNEVLSTSTITLPFMEYDELICFHPVVLKKSGIFTLGRYSSYAQGVAPDGVENEYSVFVECMLGKIRRDVEGDIEKFRKYYGLPSDVNELYWLHEVMNMKTYGHNIFYIHIDYKPVFEAYLRFLNDNKTDKINGGTIKKIEILKSKNNTGRIKVYVNGNYDNDPLDFARGKNWQLMYRVANGEEVVYDKKGKEFYDYFNSRKENPLYAKHGFEKTTILKREDGCIVPNIKIKLTTQNKITRQLKSA